MLSKEQRQKLRELAQNATPSPWKAIDYGDIDGVSERWFVDTSVEQADIYMDGNQISHNKFGHTERERADIEYIASVHPAAILSLLDMVEGIEAAATRAALERAAKVCDGEWSIHTELAMKNADHIQLRDRCVSIAEIADKCAEAIRAMNDQPAIDHTKSYPEMRKALQFSAESNAGSFELPDLNGEFLRAGQHPGWELVPTDPPAVLLRPFMNCPNSGLVIAWNAMLSIASTLRESKEAKE